MRSSQKGTGKQWFRVLAQSCPVAAWFEKTDAILTPPSTAPAARLSNRPDSDPDAGPDSGVHHGIRFAIREPPVRFAHDREHM
jgi:hypothetical protein